MSNYSQFKLFFPKITTVPIHVVNLIKTMELNYKLTMFCVKIIKFNSHNS